MSDAVQLLEAGGMIPVGEKVPTDLPTDTVDARVYTHAAIPGRKVVRLVPDAIARGVDVEMGLFGFAMTGHHDDIALQRRRTLGFPGSALVADPERARFALDVMKEFRKQAKRIQSKPGHARDGFDEIAERLARQVPHFLPSYYEEVGRAFASAGNVSYAASSFDKARTAEQKYGLKVDEELRGEAFLEFALLGALTVKSLQAYGKELQKSVGGEAAYERMFQLATRRTLGGVPPWASLPKDLRSLIKAAKKKPDEEDQRFLREVLGASSLQRAPGSFWAEYRAALIALAQREPAVRARLLDLFPNGGKTRYSWRDDDDGFQDTWFEVLVEAGAFEALWDQGAPAAAIPSGGRASWFKRLQEWTTPGDGWTLQLLRKAAPALKADAQPVEIRTGDWYRPLDLDLLDLAIELGIPWKYEDDNYRVDLAKWASWTPAEARHGFPAEHRPRDPVHAAKDPAVQPMLAPAIDSVFGNEAFEAVAGGMTALVDLRRAWLDRQIADLASSGLASTAAALARLESATSATTFAEFPHASEAVAAVSASTALHRTLVTGVLDELGWPAFDQATAELGFAADTEFHVNRQWPYLILANQRKAYVLGPAGIELVHDLKLPKDQGIGMSAYVGKQLYVSWSSWSSGKYATTAYWSGKPSDTFEVEHAYNAGVSTPWTLPDALILGATRFSAGDRSQPPQVLAQFHDADKSWVLVPETGELHEQDRQTGKATAKGAPGFLQGVTHYGEVAYFVVPPEVAGTSPLPVVDGQFGSKFVRPAEKAEAADDDDLDAYDDEEGGPASTEIRLETLGGERYVGTFRHGNANYLPTMLARWPGGALRAVREEQQWWRNAHNPHFYVADPDRPQVAIAHDGSTKTRAGWLPSARYWHYLVPRDPKGSAALRALDPAVAAELVEVAKGDESSDGAAIAAAVERLLPKVTDPVLRKGLVLVVGLAGDLERRLGKLREQRKGGAAPVRSGDDVDDSAAGEALSNLGRYYTYGNSSVTAAIRTLGAYLVKAETGTNVLSSRLDPPSWLGRIRALGWCLTRPGLEDRQRAVLVKILRAWVDSGLADDVHLRVGRMRIDKLEKSWIATRTDDGELVPYSGWRHSEDHKRLLVWDCSEDSEGPWVVNFAEWADDPAQFADYPSSVVTSERRVSPKGDRAWIEGLLEVASARTPSEDDVRAFADATGLTPGEAGLALAIFPAELDKETREAMGLKAAEVKAAAKQFSLDVEAKLELLASAAPADPAELASPVASAALQAAWLARFGKAVPVPTELLTLAEKELSGGGARLKQLANPGSWSELSVDTEWEIGPQGEIVAKGTGREVDEDDDDEPEPGAGFTGSTAQRVAELLGWVAPKLPVGDALGANVVAVYDKVRARLRNPSLYLACGQWYLYEPKAKKAAEAWFDALGGEAVETKDEDGDVTGRQKRIGPLVATVQGWRLTLAARPAQLDPTSRDLVTAFAKASEGDTAQLNAWELLQTDDFAAMIERVRSSPLAAGEWEQNAARSAPAVVRAVVEKHGLSENAAVLYLQTLALLDPTKKNVCLWNGWTPKVYSAAAAELVEKGLVLEAKRARAGREHFLPGGWIETKDILPYEEWKRPLYGWKTDGPRPQAGTGDSFPFSDPVALAPIHVLFARAWERCAKDAPRFQEVRR